MGNLYTINLGILNMERKEEIYEKN